MRKFVFALFFVMLAAIAVAAMALRHVPVLAHLSHKSEASAKESRTLDPAGRTRLRISDGAGDVTVRPADRPDIGVAATLRGYGETSADARDSLKKLRWVAERDGDTLQIRQITEKGDRWVDVVNGTIDFDVTVPRGTTWQLETEAGSGQVALEDLHANGSVHVGSGTLTVRRVDGNLELSAGSGTVHVAGGHGDTEARAGSGTVEITDRPGDRLDLHTGSGPITLHQSGAIAHDAHLKTGSGNISVTLPANADVTVSAQAVTGTVTNDLGVPAAESGSVVGSEKTIRLGRGTYHLDIVAASGQVDLRRSSAH